MNRRRKREARYPARMRTPPVAISLDLDDTLWPIWPSIERAEQALDAFLRANCPRTAEAFPVHRMRRLREEVAAEHPQYAHDFTHQRKLSLQRALQLAGDDEVHAEPAFAAFHATRNQVDFYPDALDALRRIAARRPVAALTKQWKCASMPIRARSALPLVSAATGRRAAMRRSASSASG